VLTADLPGASEARSDRRSRRLSRSAPLKRLCGGLNGLASMPALPTYSNPASPLASLRTCISAPEPMITSAANQVCGCISVTIQGLMATYLMCWQTFHSTTKVSRHHTRKHSVLCRIRRRRPLPLRPPQPARSPWWKNSCRMSVPRRPAVPQPLRRRPSHCGLQTPAARCSAHRPQHAQVRHLISIIGSFTLTLPAAPEFAQRVAAA
jgi:hypothetical protein